MSENIEKAPNVPPFVTFVTSAVPMVFDNSLSYYEALCALWKWLQDDVVNVINNNATVTEDYIQLTNEMKEYMDNYFDNLDVQEEINNKLDAMVEDGTLQDLINAYLQPNVAWTFDTVADMKVSTNLVNGCYARTLGFHSLNDGGGAIYKISNSGTANEMDIIAIGSTLYAQLIYDEANVKQLGAYGDNTQDDTAVFTYALTKNNVYIPAGNYKITSSLDLIEEQTIRGESDSKITYTGNDYLFNAEDIIRFNIKNLFIVGNNSNNAFSITGSDTGCADFALENLKIYNASIGLNLAFAWDFIVKNVRIISSSKPIIPGSQTNNATFLNCYFSGFSQAIECINNEGVLFESCDFTNYTGSNYFISFYQCKTSFVNCYFENLGSQRKNVLVSSNEGIKSNISFIGGKISKMDSTYPLTIQASKATINIEGINKGDICVVADNYPNTVNQYCCGLSLSGLDIPSSFYDNRYTAVLDFKGDYEVTFSAYGTLTQAFADGEITLSTTGSTEYGIKIPVTTNKNYLMIMDLSLPVGVTTVKIWQNANALARNVDVVNNRLILPINTVSDELRITFPYTVSPVKISRFYLGELV